MLCADEPPVLRLLFVRRFLCRDCGAVCTVVPQEVAPGRLYSIATIALALVLFGVQGVPAEEIFSRLSPIARQGFDHRRWRVLDRWVRSIRQAKLFSKMTLAFSEDTPSVRAAAAGFAQKLGALSRRIRGPLEETVVDGAMMAI